MLDLKEILTVGIESDASDIHLVPAHRPMMVVDTDLAPVEEFAVIEPEDTDRMVKEMVGEKRHQTLLQRKDLDFSTSLGELGRFRVNAHFQKDCIGIAFRVIKSSVPPIDSLYLPAVVQQLANLPRGLVLVTGPTGSGKSTTLASMIDAMNEKFDKHVITVEDPIEYLLTSKKCLIEQRELGADVPTFASGLRHALRQAPDVILVGEMRDLETTSAALTAAETGHLVLSTLHTQSTAQTIERIVDIYPGDQQRYILSMLSNTLRAAITQTLFRRNDQPGMIPALEILLCNSAVRNCIRENRIHEIPNIIKTNRASGMCPMDESIRGLYLNGFITAQQAIDKAADPQSLRKAISA